MFLRSVPFVRGSATFAALFLLSSAPLLAGDRVHSPSRPAPRSQPAPAAVARPVVQAVTISFVVPPPQAKPQQFQVDLRGPDGQTRRFAVEGGPDAIQTRHLALRPGGSVTIVWLAAK